LAVEASWPSGFVGKPTLLFQSSKRTEQALRRVLYGPVVEKGYAVLQGPPQSEVLNPSVGVVTFSACAHHNCDEKAYLRVGGDGSDIILAIANGNSLPPRLEVAVSAKNSKFLSPKACKDLAIWIHEIKFEVANGTMVFSTGKQAPIKIDTYGVTVDPNGLNIRC
jgi:hypothetical protein